MEPETLPYFYNLNELQANAILRKGPVGAYLLRKSSQPEAICTLSVRGHVEIFNVRIYRTTDGRTCFLEAAEPSKRYFDDLKSLVEYFAAPERSLMGQAGSIEASFKLIMPMMKPRKPLDAWL